MKRFIIFSVAVLLRLESSQAVPDTKEMTPNLQTDFVYFSNQLAMPWDTLTLDANPDSCKIY
jgi:hypothetical protein